MIYTLTLNPALDYDIYLEELKIGELNISKSANFRAGGKGINVSKMLNNLGIKNIALGYIAGFVGEYIKEDLKKEKIISDFIKVEGINRINIKLFENDETEISGKSIEISDKKIKELYQKLKKLEEEDILVLSGSIPSSLPTNIYEEISKMTKAKVVLDTRAKQIKENVCDNLLIKPNIVELEECFGRKFHTFDEIYDACTYFLDKNVEYVIVSMGGSGAILIKKDEIFFANVPKGNLINSIGSGDSLVAGFIYAYINNLEILKYAVACGSATAFSNNIAKREEVYKYLDEIEVVPIKYGEKIKITEKI